MKKYILWRFLGLSLVVAGLGLSSTSVSAAGEATFKIDSLTVDNRVVVDMDDLSDFDDDGGLVAITPSKVLVGFEVAGSVNGGVAYGLDLTSPTAADFAEESVILVNDLADQSAYVFPAPDVSIASIGGQFTWDEIVKLDASGNVASRVTLSPAIVIASDEVSNEDCINLGSGNGVIGVWDLCTGTFWQISLPSGTVTSFTDSVADFLDYNDENLWPVYDFTETDTLASQPGVNSGVLEYFDGTWYMALPAENYDGDVTSIARFSVFEPTASPEVILDLQDWGPDLYTFAVSTEAGIWCSRDESAPEEMYGPSRSDEMVGCWDGTFTSVPALPSTGADSAVTLMLGLGFVATGAAVTVGSRRRRTA